MIPLRDVIPSRTTPVVTLGLIALNLLVFLFQTTLGERDAEAFIALFGLVPASFDWSQVVTSMFVHAGAAHLAGNLLFLWIFGDNVEDRLGHGRYLGLYAASGVVAALSQAAVAPESLVPMVGASGAIAGVMGAYLVLYPRSRVLMLLPLPPMLYEVPAIVFLVLWFALQFLNGIGALATIGAGDLSGGVAFWAHVMGFVAGLVLVRLLRRPEREEVEWWDVRKP